MRRQRYPPSADATCGRKRRRMRRSAAGSRGAATDDRTCGRDRLGQRRSAAGSSVRLGGSRRDGRCLRSGALPPAAGSTAGDAMSTFDGAIADLPVASTASSPRDRPAARRHATDAHEPCTCWSHRRARRRRVPDRRTAADVGGADDGRGAVGGTWRRGLAPSGRRPVGLRGLQPGCPRGHRSPVAASTGAGACERTRAPTSTDAGSDDAERDPGHGPAAARCSTSRAFIGDRRLHASDRVRHAACGSRIVGRADRHAGQACSSRAPGIRRLRRVIAANAHRDEITDSDFELLVLALLPRARAARSRSSTTELPRQRRRLLAEIDLAYPHLKIAIELDGKRPPRPTTSSSGTVRARTGSRSRVGSSFGSRGHLPRPARRDRPRGRCGDPGRASAEH